MKARGTIGICAAALLVALSTGCGADRTRGQRHQVRALDAVLQAEADRLAEVDTSADPAGTVEEYRELVNLYSDLVNDMVRSATGKPIRVQQAEDNLILLADEARGLRAYQSWDPDTQLNFERQFWRNRMQPWQQWRGPGWQTHREAYTVKVQP